MVFVTVAPYEQQNTAVSVPPAHKVSALRQRMIDDMTVRNLAPNTMLCYLKQVSYLARYFGKSPEQLGPEEIRDFQLYLAQDRKVSVQQPVGGGHRPPVPLRRYVEAGAYY